MWCARVTLRVSEANRAGIADNLLKGHLSTSEKFIFNKVRGVFLNKNLQTLKLPIDLMNLQN